MPDTAEDLKDKGQRPGESVEAWKIRRGLDGAKTAPVATDEKGKAKPLSEYDPTKPPPKPVATPKPDTRPTQEPGEGIATFMARRKKWDDAQAAKKAGQAAAQSK